MNSEINGREELMQKIHALSFAMTEAQLFLDTHPDSLDALTYFKDMRAQLDTAMTEYQNKYGPLFADMTVGDKWTWIDGPWPWQHGKEK